MPPPITPPTFAAALRFWIKLGFISFGGPTGQIAIMHAELVERRRWVSEARFLHALNYCMLLPGPEAQQLATYIGWLLHGTRGGLVAGICFVLPAVFILLALSWIYAAHGSIPAVAALFFGLKPAVMAIVADAVIRIGRKALRNRAMLTIAAAAFLALFVFAVPFPFIIVTAALIGFVGSRRWPRAFDVVRGHAAAADADTPMALHADATAPPSVARALRALAIGLTLWWTPVAALGLWQGWNSLQVHAGLFFSKAALVTFGGAYAVLPYVSQAAVQQFGWLTTPQMIDGLGLAETTPGPLIMVLQFVGFMAGWQHPGTLVPWTAATLGALITTWVTFVPCFLWIFMGAPWFERLHDQRRFNAGLSAITASVVGVVLNLAVWFAGHTLFPAGDGRLNGFALVVGLIAFAGLVRWRWSVVAVVLASGLLGLLRHLCFG